MKICINSSCKAELDDYTEICPECGRRQKVINMPPKKGIESDNIVRQERHGFITFWLWAIIVGNILMAVISFFPKAMYGSDYPDAYVIFSIISALFAVPNIIGAFWLLEWKKVGFWILTISAICGGLFAFFTTGALPVGLLGPLILYFVLQITKNGMRYWDCLN